MLSLTLKVFADDRQVFQRKVLADDDGEEAHDDERVDADGRPSRQMLVG